MPKVELNTDDEKKISEILHYVWDPAGIAGEPACRDEYDGYVPGVLLKVRHEFMTEVLLADYLEQTAIKAFGRPYGASVRTAKILWRAFRQ